GVGREDAMDGAEHGRHLLGPRPPGGGGQLDLAEEPVGERPEDLLLRADVAVERHDAHAALLGDAAHRERLEAFGLDQGRGGVDDRIEREPAGSRPPAALRLHPPSSGPLTVRIPYTYGAGVRAQGATGGVRTCRWPTRSTGRRPIPACCGRRGTS